MRTSPLAAAALLACATSGAGSSPEGPTSTSAAPETPGWAPRLPAREAKDREEIQALLAALEHADARSDIEAVASLIDFPVLMVADDASGASTTVWWPRERWLRSMAPLYAPLPGTSVEHHPTFFLVSDSIATVTDEQTVTLGKRRLRSRTALLLVRVTQGWRIKALLEGGWGVVLRKLAAEP